MKISTLAALLGLALLAVMVAPAVGAPAAEPEADPKCPKGDEGNGGGEEEGGGNGGGPLIDLELLLSIDLSGLGDLLNAILGLLIKMKEMDDAGDATSCDKEKMAEEMNDLLLQLDVYLSLLGIDVQVALKVLLGPLLEAVGQLLQALLGGQGLGGLIQAVLNLVLGLLASLNLNLAVDVAVKLGEILNLDVLALLKIG